jgi:cytochrome c
MQTSRPGYGALCTALFVALVATTGCDAGAKQAAAVTGGDLQRGRSAIFKYGCGSCHTVAGISDAHGLVGPPLSGIGNRMYVAGVLPNTPDNIVHWIRNPKEVDAKTVMPVLGVSAQDATDIAAYLYSTK